MNLSCIALLRGGPYQPVNLIANDEDILGDAADRCLPSEGADAELHVTRHVQARAGSRHKGGALGVRAVISIGRHICLPTEFLS